jgi:hypothetical protein
MPASSSQEQINTARVQIPEWTKSRAPMVGSKEKIVRRYTLLFGVISGLTFSLSLWGVEAITLSSAHVAYAWIPLVVGTPVCILVCLMAAGLTYLANKALLGILFWLLAAVLVAGWTIALPMSITPRLILFFEPGLRSRLPVYPYDETVKAWVTIAAVWLAIFFAIFGLLQLVLVEQAAFATAPASRLMPYFVCIPLMALASILSSNILNDQLRTPLVVTNELIQFAVDNQGKTVDPALARSMHLSAVNSIADLINLPRRLFLGQFNGALGQVEVLIDFSGKWAECDTISGQLIFCQPMSIP